MHNIAKAVKLIHFLHFIFGHLNGEFHAKTISGIFIDRYFHASLTTLLLLRKFFGKHFCSHAVHYKIYLFIYGNKRGIK